MPKKKTQPKKPAQFVDDYSLSSLIPTMVYPGNEFMSGFVHPVEQRIINSIVDTIPKTNETETAAWIKQTGASLISIHPAFAGQVLDKIRENNSQLLNPVLRELQTQFVEMAKDCFQMVLSTDLKKQNFGFDTDFEFVVKNT